MIFSSAISDIHADLNETARNHRFNDIADSNNGICSIFCYIVKSTFNYSYLLWQY